MKKDIKTGTPSSRNSDTKAREEIVKVIKRQTVKKANKMNTESNANKNSQKRSNKEVEKITLSKPQLVALYRDECERWKSHNVPVILINGYYAIIEIIDGKHNGKYQKFDAWAMWCPLNSSNLETIKIKVKLGGLYLWNSSGPKDIFPTELKNMLLVVTNVHQSYYIDSNGQEKRQAVGNWDIVRALSDAEINTVNSLNK
jgi:hypothetical protein